MPDLLQVVKDWDGFHAVSEAAHGADYDQRLTEVVNLLTNSRGLRPHEREYLIREALTTSDFPFLFGDVLDRQVLGAYKAVDPVWRAFTKMSTVNDFRTAYRFKINGGDQVLAVVPEKGEYQASARTELRYPLAVQKYGRQFDISWESLVNDDLGALKDTPERFAKAAVRTEHRVVTGLYAGDVGTHTEGAGGNLYEIGVNGTADALTIASLEAAMENQAALQDTGDEPIMNRPKFLVVPPALEFTARQILTSANKMWMDHVTRAAASAATLFPMPTANVISQAGLVLVIDPYLPVLDTTSDEEGWYLFSDPSDIAALEAAHLTGHERPEIAMKSSDKVNVGGGPIGPMDGDFATDNVLYRVRLVFGATKLDWRATFMGGYQG